MRSLFSGVSGLKSHQTRMDVIGNNIANINTVGFKSSRTTFSDMLSQTTKGAAASSTRLGGTNPLQIGLGTSVASIDLITSDGSPQSTGKNTDVALSGNGMFVLKNGDQYFYTRDGAFEFDEAGNYVLPGSGNYVQGWNAIDGSLNTNSDPTNIVVPAGRAMEATATSTVDFSGNLNASSPTIESITYTQGGAGADTSLVVNSYDIDSMSLNYKFTIDASDTLSTYAIGDTGTSTADTSYSGSITSITLTLTSGTTTTTTTITGGTTDYKLGDTYGNTATTITAISATYSGTKDIQSGDTDSYAVGQALVTDAGVTVTNIPSNTRYTYTFTKVATDTSTSFAYSDTKTLGTYSGTATTLSVIIADSDGNTSTVTANATTNSNVTFKLNGTYNDGTADYTVVSITATYNGYHDLDSDETLPSDGAVVYATTDTTISSIALSLSDPLAGSTSAATVTTKTSSYTLGGKYGTESVNVDGKNVIAAVLTLSDGTTQKVTSGFYEVGHSVPITTIVTLYDSEGKTHAVTMLIDKDAVSEDPDANTDAVELGNDNRWRVYVSPAEGTIGPSTTFKSTEEDGSITNGYFNVITDESGNPTSGAVSYLYFNADGSYSTSATTGGSLFLQYSNGNGADDTTSSVNFTGLTQFSGSSTAYPTADGNSYGVLQSVSIDSSGILTGTYTNGTRRFEAQLAVAQFINPAGLTKTGTSLYQASNNSGAANVKTVTDLGLSITPSALEMSNVDLASELADMIVTQRGFQSNSKIISVGDEMLETLVNMKR